MLEPTSRRYHIAHKSQKVGPLSLAELASRRLSSDMLVWCEGMPDWVPIGDLSEFRPYVHHATAPGVFAPPNRSIRDYEPLREARTAQTSIDSAPPMSALPPASLPPPPNLGRKRSLFLGIASIVLGSLGLACCPFSIAGTLFQPVPQQVAEGVDIPTFIAGRTTLYACMLIVSVPMIVAGIGLLYRRRWAAMTCAVSSMICLVAYLSAAVFETGIVHIPLLGMWPDVGGDPEARGFIIGFVSTAVMTMLGGVAWHATAFLLVNSAAVRSQLR